MLYPVAIARARAWLSWGSLLLGGVLCQRRCGVLVSRSPAPSRAPASFADRPRLLARPVHPPTSFTSPSERSLSAPAPSAARFPAKPRSTSLGISSLIAASPAASTLAGFPGPASFRPRRFSRPRRFAPPPASRVCFAPLPRPGFALQGFAPPRASARAFARRCPLAVSTASGPSSAAESPTVPRGAADSPPGLSLLRVCCLLAMEPGHPDPSALGLRMRTLAIPRSGTAAFLWRTGFAALFRELRTRSRFSAFRGSRPGFGLPSCAPSECRATNRVWVSSRKPTTSRG